MCRWLGYVGSPIDPRELLYDTERSLVEQSRQRPAGRRAPNARRRSGSAGTASRESPGAVSERPRRRGATATCSAIAAADPLAAVPRARPRGDRDARQQTNCHPFRHGRWLFMHNGFIDGYIDLRRDLLLAVDPPIFSGIAARPTPS